MLRCDAAGVNIANVKYLAIPLTSLDMLRWYSGGDIRKETIRWGPGRESGHMCT